MENIKNYLPYLKPLNFDTSRPAVIDFYATWCGPCRSLAPSLERIQNEYVGRVQVLKIDVDKNEEFASAMRIQSIPTLLFVTRNGDFIRSLGGMPYSMLEEKVQTIL